ncbi:MAG TPA: S8 family serine peptidase, partial [Longimicrobiaceae bacterium]|nr:S8 family serine peptidase [Longimicrobiaceae bacterium]
MNRRTLARAGHALFPPRGGDPVAPDRTRRLHLRRTIPLAARVTALGLAACEQAPTLAPESAALNRSENAPIYLVTFKEGVDVQSTAGEIARARGFAIRFIREHAAPGFSAVIPASQIDAIRSDPRVAIVEKDGPVQLIKPVEGTARPGGGGGGQTTPWGITRVGGAGDGTGKTAWVIDSGIDLAHADLNTTRNCHTYYAGTSPNDGNGHGTHVAGTIAAKNNGIDVVGVAANAYVCSVRVLGNSGSGSWEGVVNGVNFVAANGANGDVANMSLGGSGSNTTLETAIKNAAAKGITFVIAAGNSGQDAENETPARLDAPNVFTISAIGTNGCLTSWSNYGLGVDWAAPGSGIVSTRKGGGTTSMSGTSMAAPHAAGVLL